MSTYEKDTFMPDSSSVDLSEFDDDFAAAESPSLEEVPDGKYQVRIDEVRLDRSQKGDPMIKWDLIVIAGAQAGRHIFKNSVITPAALPFVKGDLNTLGLELARFSELNDRLGDLLDMTLEVTKRTRGEYSNVYFNKRINIAGNGAAKQLASDEIPF
ncbi:MAG: DUF669 domain-containing protein [Caldilineaceae bacterium]|nr:DUF669 domain-containing protein [Caldilineaceae bacterium]